MLVFFTLIGIIVTINLLFYFSTIKAEIEVLDLYKTEKSRIKIDDFNIKIYLNLRKKN